MKKEKGGGVIRLSTLWYFANDMNITDKNLPMKITKMLKLNNSRAWKLEQTSYAI